MAWIINYIPYKTMDVIIHPCHNHCHFLPENIIIACLPLRVKGYLISTNFYTIIQFTILLTINIKHYSGAIMNTMASQTTNLTIVYSTVYSGADEKTPKLRVTGLYGGILWWPVIFLHKGPLTWKMFPFDDVIMSSLAEWHKVFISSCYNHWQSVYSMYIW